MNAKEEFESRFYKEEKELIVLTKEAVGGAAVVGDILRPSLEFLASVDGKTGEFSREKGRLEWLIKNVPGRSGWGYDFRQFGIYRLRVRKSIPVKLEPYMSKTMNNCFMVLEILEKNAAEPRLEEIGKQISRPVIIEEPLGKFKLDRQFASFEGEIEWLGEDCGVFLETDEEDGDTAWKALRVLRELHKDLESWDSKFRQYAAEKLTDLANEWLAEDEEQAGADPITKDAFAGRLEISEISIAPDGDITVYYHDDDMFWGHVVEIDANIREGILNANIAG